MTLRHDEQEDEGYYDDRDRSFSEGSLKGRINFSTKKLYGRQWHLERLGKAFKKLSQDDVDNKTQIILLQGVSGTGKSSLVTEFIKQLHENDESSSSSSPSPSYLFISGKHEELHSSDPFSAIVGALNRMCSGFKELFHPSDLEERINTLKHAVGDEGKVLIDMVPDLAVLLGDVEATSTSRDMIKKENALKYVFQNFFKALCTEQRPVIMFLDDLQWADKASLDLLKSLLLDQAPQHFMFIGSFRSNEVDEDDQLFEVLTEIGKNNHVENIELLALKQDDIGEFIADSLNLTLEEALPLTEVVYGKTQGNIFFTKQSLEELLTKNALYYDLIAFRWEWNLTKVELETALSDTVLEAVKSKLRTLPHKLQRGLTIASYTRSTFDVSTLIALMKADGCPVSMKEMTNVLDKAVVKGLLLNCVGTKHYSFAHDNIQQAAYSFVSGDDANRLRIVIAKVLLDAPIEEREDWMLFAAADNLNTVPSHDMDPIAQCKLNLLVGEKSVAISALGAAAMYLRKSLKTLKEMDSPWTKHYDIWLRLYRVSANVELALGNFELGYQLSEHLIENASTLEDKLPTFISYGLGLDRNNRHADSIEVQQTALKLLDQYPSRFLMFHVFKDFQKVRTWLRKHSDGDILNLQRMTDERKLAAMELLANISFEAYLAGNLALHMFAIIRRMRLTLQYGLCAQSAVAFAQYGVLLSFGLKNQISASRMGEIARRLVDVVDGKHVYSILEFIVSGYIEVLAAPPSEQLENFERGYRYGMECGENEHATYNLSACTSVHFFSGYNLRDVLKLTNGIIHRSTSLKDENMASFHQPWKVLQEHLVGEVKIPKDWKDVFVDLSTSGFSAEKLRQAYVYRLQLAVYFGQTEWAHRQAELARTVRCTDVDVFAIMLVLFFSCLASTAKARETGKKRYLSEAVRATKEIQNLMRKRGRTYWHKILLMEAECQATHKKPNMTNVLSAYERAISASREGAFILDEALATELAGRFLLNQKCDLTGRDYLRTARDLYKQWGADGKVNQMVELYGDQLNHPSPTMSKRNKTSQSQFTCKTASASLLESVSGNESISEKVSLDLGLVSRSNPLSRSIDTESRSEDPWTTMDVDVVEKEHLIPSSDISCITTQTEIATTEK